MNEYYPFIIGAVLSLIIITIFIKLKTQRKNKAQIIESIKPNLDKLSKEIDLQMSMNEYTADKAVVWLKNNSPQLFDNIPSNLVDGLILKKSK